jgi:transposase
MNCTPIVRHNITIGGAVFMSKYSTEEKLEAVLAYLEGKESYKAIAKERKMSMAPLKRWVLRYREHGVEGLVSSYTNYDIEFKMDILHYMNEFGASINETAARYNLASDYTVLRWKRQFEAGGIDALQPMKKGRLLMKKESKKPTPVEGSTEALQAEVEHLRMENAYLKKLNALVQSKGKLPSSTKRK